MGTLALSSDDNKAIVERISFSDSDKNVVTVETQWASGEFIIPTCEEKKIEDIEPEQKIVISELPDFRVMFLEDELATRYIWSYPLDATDETVNTVVSSFKEIWKTSDNPFNELLDRGWEEVRYDIEIHAV